VAPALGQTPAAPEPIIRRDALERVGEHTWVIPDDNVGFVPNVGIVVGERATLIVDTGLGERNGAIVLEEARGLSDNTDFYITATHFHPEHDLGATAFPASARMVRWQGQQDEADAVGAATIDRFSQFSAVVAELLDGASYRAPDLLFEDALTLDLGGVRVRMTGVGPNHTLGDTVFFVEEDGVLFTGDVVMSVFPSVSAQAADLGKWLGNLDDFEALNPRVVVPAHGRLGDVGFIRAYRSYLGAVIERVGAAKRGGASAEEASDRLQAGLVNDFAGLQQANGQAGGRVNAAIQAAWRQAP
jgi:glyoxylase-like metal-dependent hydrolase (beta-lactamase superfamily II)